MYSWQTMSALTLSNLGHTDVLICLHTSETMLRSSCHAPACPLFVTETKELLFQKN